MTSVGARGILTGAPSIGRNRPFFEQWTRTDASVVIRSGSYTANSGSGCPGKAKTPLPGRIDPPGGWSTIALCGARSDGRLPRLCTYGSLRRPDGFTLIGMGDVDPAMQPREFRSKSRSHMRLRRLCCGEACSTTVGCVQAVRMTVCDTREASALLRQELKRHAADNRCKALRTGQWP